MIYLYSGFSSFSVKLLSYHMIIGITLRVAMNLPIIFF